MIGLPETAPAQEYHVNSSYVKSLSSLTSLSKWSQW